MGSKLDSLVTLFGCQRIDKAVTKRWQRINREETWKKRKAREPFSFLAFSLEQQTFTEPCLKF